MVQGEWYKIHVDQTFAECVPERVREGTVGWVHASLLSSPAVAVTTATPLPTPTHTPTPDFIPVNQSQRIGPIWNESRDEEYSTEITLQKVKWSDGEGYDEPKDGYVYVVAYVRVANLGPDTQRYVSERYFQVLTGSGALLDYDYISGLTNDCDMDTVDLVAGGSTEGCVGFEVPSSGQVSLIFAPYQYNALGDGRYLAFRLR
jgi:hypothetical protein